MTSDFNINSIQPMTIDVYGIFGTFKVESPNSDGKAYKVRYFNSVASTQSQGPAGNSMGLLRELKPMRERTQSTSLTDLHSLLQRDLNDYRVANELIPYLEGKYSDVAFFPGALVALMPKQFLEGGADDPTYPQPKSSGAVTVYGDYWRVEFSKDSEGNSISLGRLSVNPQIADMIVLDGQHRVNAFRYLANSFPDATGDTVYAPFYQGRSVPTNYESELPVTVIWFEASENETVSPMLISRRLFVDVNTNARPVSTSRNILLDDTRISSVATGTLYERMSQEGFSPVRLSLLHSAFDAEDPNVPKMAVITPEIVDYGITYFLLANDEYDDLTRRISSDHVKQQNNRSRLRQHFDTGLTEDLLDGLGRADHESLAKIQKSLRKNVTDYVYEVVSKWNVLKPHFDACHELEQYVRNESVIPEPTVWDKVFCGGEGLYGAFQRLNQDGSSKKYQDAIKSLEDRFERVRAERFMRNQSEVSTAFATIKTKAVFTGLVMALFKECEEPVWGQDAVDDFIEKLNGITASEWITVLTEFKSRVTKKMQPKSWPSIRNLILRVVQNNGGEAHFGNENVAASPEGEAITEFMNESLKSWKNLHGQESGEPGIGEVRKWSKEAETVVNNAVASCGLAPIYVEGFLSDFAITRVKYVRDVSDDGESEEGSGGYFVEDSDEDDEDEQ